jgi:hypothetical protein
MTPERKKEAVSYGGKTPQNSPRNRLADRFSSPRPWPSPRPRCPSRKENLRSLGGGRSVRNYTASPIVLSARRGAGPLSMPARAGLIMRVRDRLTIRLAPARLVLYATSLGGERNLCVVAAQRGSPAGSRRDLPSPYTIGCSAGGRIRTGSTMAMTYRLNKSPVRRPKRC